MNIKFKINSGVPVEMIAFKDIKAGDVIRIVEGDDPIWEDTIILAASTDFDEDDYVFVDLENNCMFLILSDFENFKFAIVKDYELIIK